VSDWCLTPTKQFWCLFVWYFAGCFILSHDIYLSDILMIVLSFHLIFICLIFCWLFYPITWYLFVWYFNDCFILSPDIYLSDILLAVLSYHLIFIFILQSVHLLYKYTIRINFCFIHTSRINFSYYTNKLFSLQINFPGTL
jgi:hypothetical protein